jgi:acyl-coenzyme A thioesterase PaaI-like protein
LLQCVGGINDGEIRLATTGRPSVTITVTPPNLPLTNETVAEFYEWLFAPWVKELGLRDFDVAPGRVVATLPQDRKLKFASGAICGQVIMSAVDTVVSLAMATTDRTPKGTTYQHTHFLRPAMTHDMRVEANVLRFGKASAFAEAKVTFANSGELVAHATLEFAF